MADNARLICLISLYGMVFFVFLALAMSANPLYFEFQVTDERINCCIIVIALYAVAFLAATLVLSNRRHRRSQRRGIETQNLVSEEEMIFERSHLRQGGKVGKVVMVGQNERIEVRRQVHWITGSVGEVAALVDVLGVFVGAGEQTAAHVHLLLLHGAGEGAEDGEDDSEYAEECDLPGCDEGDPEVSEEVVGGLGGHVAAAVDGEDGHHAGVGREEQVLLEVDVGLQVDGGDEGGAGLGLHDHLGVVVVARLLPVGARFVVELHQLRPLGACAQKVVFAGEQRQPHEGEVHEALDRLVEVGVRGVLLAGGQHAVGDGVPQGVEPEALDCAVVGEFSHAVEGVDEDVLVVVGGAHGLLLDCVGACEEGGLLVGADELGAHLVAVVVGVVVGDEILLLVAAVDAGDQRVRVSRVHRLRHR